MNGGVGDVRFAVEAQRLLGEGEVEGALRLGREGVAACPEYATGHLILGLTLLAAGDLDEARSELETTWDMDGPAPALLQALTVCYDGLGLTDLATECRKQGEGFGQDPLKDDHEGGPEMVEERDDSLDPGDGELDSDEGPGSTFEIGDEAGSPEEALKELEALLEGAGSSLEGETIGEEVSEGNDLPTVEESTDTDGSAPEEAAPEDEDKSDLWAQILKQAEGAEGSDSPIPEAAVIDLDAAPDEETPAVEEVSAIDLDAALDEETPAVGEVSVIDLDTPIDLDDVAEFDSEVEPLDGLEVSTPGGETVDINMVEGLEETGVESDSEMVESVGDEDLVSGPAELSEDVLSAASEGIELDDTLDVMPHRDEDDAGGADDLASLASLDLTDAEGDDPETDEVLKSLEADLESATEADVGTESLLKDEAPAIDETTMDIGLDDEDAPLDLDQALEDLGESQDLDSVAPESPAPGDDLDELPEQDPTADPAGLSTEITNADDSIRLAIEAEILVGKGEYKDAVRLFEALQLWEPERESYRNRLEELRRLAQQPEEPE